MVSTDKAYQARVHKLTTINKAQFKQMNSAYKKTDLVSWRKQPLSPLTSEFLAYAEVVRETLSGDQKIGRPNVIDLGAGALEKSHWLTQRGANVHAVDMLEEAMLSGKKRIGANKYLQLTVADLCNLPFEENQFDGAHDYLALFLHVPKTNWELALKEAHRVLKPGAPLLAITFYPDEYFYGYKNPKGRSKEITKFSARNFSDKSKVSHLINSYFYFPSEATLIKALKPYFNIAKLEKISHPLSKTDPLFKNRHHWHLLAINKE